MKDKRTVDELSVEELERILLMRKRESRLKRFRDDDRRVNVPVPIEQSMPEPTQTPTPQAVAYEPPPAPPQISDDGVPRFEDDLPPAIVEQRQPERYQRVIGYDESAPKKTPRARNRLLLAVEIGAALGLVLLLVLAFQGITTINRNIEKTDSISATSEAELQQRQIQPTATPLISVSQVVLPGGHVYDANGQHQFNMTEVPAPFRDAFRDQLNAPRTEVAAVMEGSPIRLQIPAIGVDASIRSGDDWISLQAGVGHHAGSGQPGVQGNMILTGHDDIFGEVFRRLEELTPGQEVRVQSTTGEWHTYIIREKQIVEPSEVWVLDQNLGAENPITTLITCYPYRVNSHRMVVFAELVSES
jgi:sortase A